MPSILAVAATACGYRAANLSSARERVSVASAPFKSPHLEAVQAALAGLRAGLSEAGALEPGDGFPQVVVEVLRVDELPAGIENSPVAGAVPLARGSAVGVTGRAWYVTERGGTPAADTGDVRRVEYVAQGSGSMSSGNAYAEAVRGAARKVGEALARRILGEPEPAREPM